MLLSLSIVSLPLAKVWRTSEPVPPACQRMLSYVQAGYASTTTSSTGSAFMAISRKHYVVTLEGPVLDRGHTQYGLRVYTFSTCCQTSQ